VRTSRRLLALAGTATLVVAMGLFTSPAQAGDIAPLHSSPDEPAVGFIQAPDLGEPGFTWTTADGIAHTLVAITEEQAVALETSRQASLDGLTTVTVDLADILTPAEPLTPARGTDLQVDNGIASGCWFHSWSRGFDNGALAVYGSQSWCGDGSWITHTNGNCWGESWWPSYHYYGCNMSTDFGVGWNVADLHVTWHTCTMYLGWEGGCMWNVTVWDHIRYGAAGQVWWMGGSGF
jgi:hypothetical protein